MSFLVDEVLVDELLVDEVLVYELMVFVYSCVLQLMRQQRKLSICQLVNLSTCQLVNLSTCKLSHYLYKLFGDMERVVGQSLPKIIILCRVCIL